MNAPTHPVRSGTRLVLATAAGIGLLVASGGTAAAVTFGANLAQWTANNTGFTCGTPIWPVNPFGGVGGGASLSPIGGGASCTIYSSANTTTRDGTQGLVVPLPDPVISGNQTGTITQVRVKSGAIPAGAKARLLVVTSVRPVDGRNGDVSGCCTGAAVSADFTLTPNGIATVNTDLPVASRYNAADKIVSFSVLALSIPSPSTPLPVHVDSIDASAQSGYCSGLYVPEILVGQERFQGAISRCDGVLPLISADLAIGGGGGGGQGGVAAAGARAKVAKGRAAVPLTCPAGAACVGNLVLSNRKLTGAQEAAKKGAVVRYGTARFTVAAGKTARVSVKLTARGRALLKSARSAGVWANVTPAGGATTSTRVRLSR